MSDPPLITAVIPAFNPQEFLLEAIASVERQTHPNWEVVLVDDGTAEDSGLELIAAVERRADPRIRVLRQPNQGLAAARNSGFRAARGEYVVPLDADDLIEPEMMAVTLAELERHHEAAFAYGDYRVFGDVAFIQRPGEYNLYRLIERNFLTYCMLFRKSIWEQVGGYPEEMRQGYEDWAFAIKLGILGHYGRYIPQTLFRYRRQGRSLYSIALERHDENLALMERLLPEALSPAGPAPDQAPLGALDLRRRRRRSGPGSFPPDPPRLPARHGVERRGRARADTSRGLPMARGRRPSRALRARAVPLGSSRC